MYRLYFTDREVLTPDEIAVLDSKHIPEHLPFFIKNNGDFAQDVNQFFLNLASRGAATSTLNGYARDLSVWFNYLTETLQKDTIWDADNDDIVNYNRARRFGDSGVTASTWNRNVAALSKFYSYGVKSEHCVYNPFRDSILVTPQGVQINTNTEVSYEKRALKNKNEYVTPAEWEKFVTALRSSKDSLLCAERNYAFATLLLNTGLRCDEANSLSFQELETERSTNGGLLRVELPAVTTKTKTSRTIFLPPRALDNIKSYIDIERSIIVIKANANGAYEKGKWTKLTKKNGKFVNEGGKTVSLSKLTSSQRTKVLIQKPDGSFNPLCIWLGASGEPLQASSWTQIFANISERGGGLNIHPHRLRHTYAINLLSALEKTKVLGDAGLLVNSLRTVQLVLGHASIDSTTTYLGSVDLYVESLDAAITHLQGDI